MGKRLSQCRKTFAIGRLSDSEQGDGKLTEDLLEASKNVVMKAHHRNSIYAMRVRWNDGEGEDIFEELHDILSNYLPALCYLGRKDGGYGVWPDDGEVPFHGPATLEVGKGSELPIASRCGNDYFLLVNDHGNCTLYCKVINGRGLIWKEEWSIV